MDRIVVQIVFETCNLLHGVSAFFIAVNSPGPRDVLVSRSITTTNMIVNKHAEPFVIVTQQRVGASLSSNLQRLTCGSDWQRQHANGLQCRSVFGQCSVM